MKTFFPMMFATAFVVFFRVLCSRLSYPHFLFPIRRAVLPGSFNVPEATYKSTSASTLYYIHPH